jgi:membrane-associated phospholipid phosphatase
MPVPAVRVFLMVVSIFLLPLLVAVLLVDPFALHMHLNAFHGPVSDAVLAKVTHLADTGTSVSLVLLMLLFRWRHFVLMGLSAGLSAALTQTVKHVLFPDRLRPSQLVEHMPGLELVPGVELLQGHSFPSGHATAAFSMGLACAVLVERKGPAVVFSLLAVLVGFSRIHLSQHFPLDVLVGALIGTLTAYGVHRWAQGIGTTWTERLDRAPFKVWRQNQ